MRRYLLRHVSIFELAGLIVGVALIYANSADSHSGPGSASTRRSFVYPPKEIAHVTFGYGESMADSLWIRVIQDIDVCDQSDRELGLPALLQPEGQIQDSRCKNGWVFAMFDAITELAPRFLAAHKVGATLLSVLVDDRTGAKALFDKGLARFPNDAMLAFQASYHYLFEIRDKKRAAELLVQAGRNGFPAWVFAAAANLQLQEGQAAIAKTILEDGLKRGGDEPSMAQMKKRMHLIEEAISKSTPSSQSETRK
jgi:hypothetical protein